MAHWKAVKRIFRYLKGTINLKICFSRSNTGEIIGFSDADWASDIDKRRSCTGYVFNFSGAAISWKSAFTPHGSELKWRVGGRSKVGKTHILHILPLFTVVAYRKIDRLFNSSQDGIGEFFQRQRRTVISPPDTISPSSCVISHPMTCDRMIAT